MEKQETNREEYYMIDLRHVLKTLWKRMWLIVLAGVLAAGAGYAYSAYGIAPTYSSHIKLYVNNSSISLGNTTFTLSELTAAQSLAKTYGEILDTRSTLEMVAEQAEVDYSWRQLSGMIDCSPSNETEIMLVTVTCNDPYVACNIAHTIAEVLPQRVTEIISGASMAVVDDAVPELNKVGPDITRYTAIGLVLGVLAAGGVLLVLALLDGTIHDEEYILRTYDYPILGKVPDLLDTGSKSYGYYAQKRQRSES